MSRGATRTALRTLASGLRQLLAVRWVRVLAVLALLALAGRLALGVLLSTVVSRLAAQRELSVTWEDLDLSLLGGSGAVRWLELAPLTPSGQPGESLFEIEYAVFDLDVLRLLRGELSVRRAEVDGADLFLERDAQGRWNFEQHIAAAEVLSLLERTPGDEAPEDDAPGEIPAVEAAQPIELLPPVAIEALRFQQARLHLADLRPQPPRRFMVQANAYLSSLRSSDRPTRFGLELFGADLLDTARVDGEARWSESGLQVELRSQVGAQNLDGLADYLEPLRVRPVAGRLDAAFRAAVELSVVGELQDALAARVELREASIAVDGTASLALERLALQLESLSAAGARASALEVSGARGSVELQPDGALRVAGFDLLAAPRQPRPAPSWEDVVASVLDLTSPGTLPRWIALASRADPEAWPWSIGRAAAEDCAFQVVDRGVEPPVTFALQVQAAELSGLIHDPRLEPQEMPFSARMAAPGLARSIAISGTLQPWAPRRTLALELALEGLAPASADAYLASAGLERALSDGSLRLAMSAEALEQDGVTRGWIEAREVALEESGELLGVRELALRDVVLDPDARRLRLGEMVVTGPRLAFVRDPAASILALGLRVPAQSAPAPAAEAAVAEEQEPAAEVEPAAAAQSPDPVVLEIGRAAWLDSQVRFLDQTTDPPSTFALDELGLELTGLVLGGDPDGPPYPPARVTGRLRSAGLAELVELEGLVHSRPGALDLEAAIELRGDGLQATPLAPYLTSFGITPLLEDGRLAAKAVATLRVEDAGWVAGLEVEGAELSAGDELLLGLERLALERIALEGEVLELGSTLVARPFARIGRDATGGLLLGGFRVAVTASEREGLEPIPWPHLPPIHVQELVLEGAALDLADATFEPPLELELLAGARIRDLARDGRPVSFEVELAVPQVVEQLALRGGLRATATELNTQVDLSCNGIGAGPLAALLPAGVELEREDGRFRARLDAALTRSEPRRGSVRLEVADVSWGPGEEEPWLALEELLVDVPRLDLVDGTADIAALRTRGLEVAARRDAEGVIHALGLRLGAAGPPAQPQAATEPTAAEPASGELPARPGTPLPTVSVGEVRLALDRFVFVDESLGEGARPLSGSISLALDPGVVLQPEPAELAPSGWHVEGALDGLVEHWKVDGSLALFAAEPRLEAELTASGVRTTGLVELVPALAGRVRGEVE